MGIVYENILLTIVLETDALPRPEIRCVPLALSWKSSPRYRMEVMSHDLELTVTTNGLSDPASTTMLFPLVVIPKAARAEEEKAKVASNALWRNIMSGEPLAGNSR